MSDSSTLIEFCRSSRISPPTFRNRALKLGPAVPASKDFSDCAKGIVCVGLVSLVDLFVKTTMSMSLLESLSSLFPLTSPIPNPTTDDDILSLKDLNREEDLLYNPDSFRHWWTAIHTTKEALNASQKTAPPVDLPAQAVNLLGPLATPIARTSLRRLTYLFEAALAQFPGSFKLWKAYLETRSWYVLGKAIKPRRAGGRKKLQEMKEALEDEQAEMLTWEGGLNPVIGWEEWKSLIATFERTLMYLPNVSLILGLFLNI